MNLHTVNRFLSVVILCLLGGLWLNSCTQSVRGVCQYGMGQSFSLSANETEVAATKDVLAPYEHLCLVNDWSIPVNRVIRGADYTFYICFADSSISTAGYVSAQEPLVKVPILRRDTTLNQQSWHALLFSRDSMSICQLWRPSKVPGMNEIYCVLSQDPDRTKQFYSDVASLAQRLH